MARIGVFVCHCGENIARMVDVSRVAKEAGQIRGVAHAADYKYFCSEPGQKLIQQAIRTHKLTGVVVAACSPHMHEPTFRKAAGACGLNPFLCEMANIREHCSWVHHDREAATQKAAELVRMLVEKVRRDEALAPVQVPVTDRALVIGGGIAGIQAALDIANGGHPVVLVEREVSIGGHMSQLSETFPTLDCSQCILTPKMVEVSHHPNIELLTYSEVAEVSGYVGNFKVKIRRKPRYIIEDLCNGCGDCAIVCPVLVPNEFDRGLTWRHAIDIPFPQAVPAIYRLDPDSCLGLNPLACEKCAKACLPRAIDFDQKEQVVEREVGAIVVATGFELLGRERFGEYGYGQYEDVLDGLEFERFLSASGPTQGMVRRPSDGAIPKEVVFIQCVGSRDPAKGVPYCSKICCMYTAKQAMLLKHKVPDAQAYVFYMDIRAGGKGYEEFVQRAMTEDRILYLRGRVSKVGRSNGKLIVQGADTLSGEQIEIEADMVVLATAMVPNEGALEMASRLRLAVDSDGFFREAHPKLRPVETLTSGMVLAGAVQAPKDIPETVAQASAAASKVLALLAADQLERDPTIARINAATCAGCFDCLRVCPFGAIGELAIRDRQGKVVRRVAQVNEAVCGGCGTCVVTCRSQSIDLSGFSNEQIYGEIASLDFWDAKPPVAIPVEQEEAVGVGQPTGAGYE